MNGSPPARCAVSFSGVVRGGGALCCLLWLGGCRDGSLPKPEAEKRAAAQTNEAKEVVLEQVREQPLEQIIEIAGTLAADEQVSVAVDAAGRLTSISVDLASRVEQGQAIAQIDATDYQLRVDQAQASLAQARAQLGLPADGNHALFDPEGTAVVRQARASLNETQANLARARSLSQEGLTTGIELDRAEAEAVRAETVVQSALEEVRIRQASVRQRQAELGLARDFLASTVLRSPITGVVQAKLANTGEYLAVGAVVAQIVRIDPLRLRLAIPEREAANVRAGQSVQVRVEGDSASYSGLIARLAPALDLESRSLLVEADLRNPGNLRPGSFAQARIVLGTQPVPTVPRSAVVSFAGLQKVLSVVQGKAVERTVSTGRIAGERIEITAGVKAGDLIVARPGSLQQGQAVRVKQGG